MPYRYPTELPEGTVEEPWESWTTFSSHVTGAADARLCQVAHEIKPKMSRGGLAWPTLVIGSECLRVRNPQTDRAIELLPDALRDELAEALTTILSGMANPGLAGAEDKNNVWLDAVVGFVDQVVTDRLGRSPFKHGERPTTWSSGPSLEGIEEEEDPFEAETGGEVPAPDPLTQAEEDRARLEANKKSGQFLGWELRLIIAAATLTQHYFKGKLQTTKSVSRWALETLTISEVYEPYSTRSVVSLSALLGELEELPQDEQRSMRQISSVASTMREALRPESRQETISLAHLQALTEFAWDRIIRRFSLYSWYPDWPEFLVRLSMDHRSHPVGRGFTRPAPRTVSDAAGIVQAALQETTRKSAEEYPSSATGQDDKAEEARLSTYAAYADLLFAMADIREERPVVDPPAGGQAKQLKAPGSRRGTPPPASAFVTTFDVELELALASRYPDRAFVIALPVNLVEDLEGDDLASTMWLGCVVRPDDAKPILERVTEPDADAWFLFDASPSGENRPTIDAPAEGLIAEALAGHAESLGALPIVIRLAGSPLMRLPAIQGHAGIGRLGQASLVRAQLEGKLDKDRQGLTLWDDPQRAERPVEIRFVHATLLDEHHAIRLSLPEVLDTGRSIPLPPELTSGMADSKYWRYWLLLGVEMADPVIRYRVAAQVLGVSLRGDPASHLRAKRAGVVFNRRRLNSRALDMLAWCGFDVVVDATAPLPMVSEIQHYVDHLRAEVGHSWPDKANVCRLNERHEREADR